MDWIMTNLSDFPSCFFMETGALHNTLRTRRVVYFFPRSVHEESKSRPQVKMQGARIEAHRITRELKKNEKW